MRAITKIDLRAAAQILADALAGDQFTGEAWDPGTSWMCTYLKKGRTVYGFVRLDADKSRIRVDLSRLGKAKADYYQDRLVGALADHSYSSYAAPFKVCDRVTE